jgi:hypothetical protein
MTFRSHPLFWIKNSRKRRVTIPPRIRCPLCGWSPPKEDRWSCSCGNEWNTFDTGGVCPACLHQWAETQCLSQPMVAAFELVCSVTQGKRLNTKMRKEIRVKLDGDESRKDASAAFTLPFDTRDVWGKAKVPVRVTINGYTWVATEIPGIVNEDVDAWRLTEDMRHSFCDLVRVRNIHLQGLRTVEFDWIDIPNPDISA